MGALREPKLLKLEVWIPQNTVLYSKSATCSLSRICYNCIGPNSRSWQNGVTAGGTGSARRNWPMQSEGGLTTFGMPRCATLWKKLTNGCVAAYACVYGNAGNECEHASRTYNDVALQSGRHGNGLIPERGIGARFIAPYLHVLYPMRTWNAPTIPHLWNITRNCIRVKNRRMPNGTYGGVRGR